MNDLLDKIVVDPEQDEINKMKGKGFGMKLFLSAEQNQKSYVSKSGSKMYSYEQEYYNNNNNSAL